MKNPIYTSFSPPGDRLAIKATSGRIAIVNPSTGDVLQDFANQSEGEGCGVKFSADGSQLVDGSWAGDLTVRNAVTGAVVLRIHNPDELILDLTHDARRTVWFALHQPRVRGDYDELPPSHISIWQWPFAPRPTRTITFDAAIDAFTLSPDGKCIAFTKKFDDNRIYVARVSEGQIVTNSSSIGTISIGSRLAWSRDGRFITAIVKDSGPLNKRLVLLAVNDLSVVTSLPCGPFSNESLFLPNGTSLVFGGEDNRCKVMPTTELFGRGT